jgi:uncharacterized protein YprB with RNaseH-like and TPR domain/predicted nuclease with RNAse H fold/dephospho-CoA kinase
MGNQLQLGLEEARRANFSVADAVAKLKADKRLAQTLELVLAHPERVLFIDIETTGLSRHYDYITLIGWSFDGKYSSIIRGAGYQRLYADLKKAYAVVTFNGSNFDLPFLRRDLNPFPLPSIHLDLRYFAKRFRLSGGQKAIETKLGFRRPVGVREIEGVLAPVLWFQYLRGQNQALRSLIRYNCFDIEGMKFVLDSLLSKMRHRVAPRTRASSSIKRIFSLPERELKLLSDRVGATRVKSYEGKVARVHLDELRAQVSRKDLKIVGIDLTGSETRPSGWCWFDDGRVETKMLGTDEELVDETIARRPRLVSIDSPLSLPSGRTSVFDDDPGRQKYGIMRTCERTLKKRGINVYPALIQSMQRLTARGIKLARDFRERGVPVIENYPGAAQDIMGIPRKRASLEMLQAGLSDVGVTGPSLAAKVKHDELDAITASLVGVFFLARWYEALGNDEEDFLIIPDLSRRDREAPRPLVIGISGPTSAGKTTAATHLAEHGFKYARYSQTLQRLFNVAQTDGLKSSLQEYGQKIREQKGQRWLSTNVHAEVRDSSQIVIDGLRFPEDAAFWFEKYGTDFSHIYVDAPKGTRRARFAQRGGEIAAFDTIEAHPVEQKVPLLKPLANVRVTNDGTLDELYKEIMIIAAKQQQKCQ